MRYPASWPAWLPKHAAPLDAAITKMPSTQQPNCQRSPLPTRVSELAAPAGQESRTTLRCKTARLFDEPTQFNSFVRDSHPAGAHPTAATVNAIAADFWGSG